MTDLRKRLNKAGSEIHIVKNSIFRLAAKEAGVADLNGSLTGQIAVVTGQKDISAAAKVVKNFNAEFDKLKIKFGYLNNNRLESAGHYRAGGPAVHRSAARQAAGSAPGAGHQAGGAAQHSGEPARAGVAGARGQGRMTEFWSPM